jgi:hypothetical protein
MSEGVSFCRLGMSLLSFAFNEEERAFGSLGI